MPEVSPLSSGRTHRGSVSSCHSVASAASEASAASGASADGSDAPSELMNSLSINGGDRQWPEVPQREGLNSADSGVGDDALLHANVGDEDDTVGNLLMEYRQCTEGEREVIVERIFCELSAFRRATNVMKKTGSLELSLTESLLELQKAILEVLECERCTLFVVDERTQEIRSSSSDSSSMSDNAPVIRVPYGKGVAGKVAATGEGLNIPDAYNSELFNPDIDKMTGFTTRNILCCPIRDTSGQIVAVMQALNHKGGPFTRVEEQNLDMLSVTMGNQIRNSQLRSSAAKEKKRSRALYKCMRCMANMQTLHDINEVIVDTVLDLVDAEWACLFLYDEVRKELWPVGGASDRVPLGKTVVGRAAQENCIETLNHKLDPEIDLPEGIQQRSPVDFTHPAIKAAMAVPVHDKAGRVVGVLLALNKRDSDVDFTIDRSFTKIDGEVMEIFAVELGDAIAKRAVEAAFANAMHSKEGGAGHYADRDAYMSQLLQYRHQEKRDSVAGIAADTQEEEMKLRSRLLMRRGSIQRAFLMRWDLEILSLTKTELIELCCDIFRDADISAFSIKEDQIRAFITAACAQYQDVPYHNFWHATHVLHATYMLLMTTEAMSYLTNLDRLILLIVAIGHDIDHDGHTNSFHQANSSDLACRYNDKSVLENHHASMTWRLLTDASLGLLSSLSQEDKLYLRNMMIELILSTDMSHHVDLLTEFKNTQFSQFMSEQHKVLFMKSLLHSADVGNAVRHFKAANALSRKIQSEFGEQVAREKELNLPSAPYMNPANEQVAWNLEANFIDYVCLPLWIRLAEVIPSVRPCLKQIEHTRDNFRLFAEGKGSEVDETEERWLGLG